MSKRIRPPRFARISAQTYMCGVGPPRALREDMKRIATLSTLAVILAPAMAWADEAGAMPDVTKPPTDMFTWKLLFVASFIALGTYVLTRKSHSRAT